MDQPNSEWKRNCPECKREIVHKLECTRDRAIEHNLLCRSCGCKKSKANWTDEDRKRVGANVAAGFAARSPEQKAKHRQKLRDAIASWDDDKKRAKSEWRTAYNLEHFKGEGNPFFGRKHKPETIEKLKQRDASYTKTPEFSAKVKASMVGIDTSCDLMKVWTDKHGIEEASRLESQRRSRLSKSMSGSGNPMYGKPAPLAAGGGVKGWYKSRFFRSLRELSYMLQLEAAGLNWVTGETAGYVVSYTNPYTNSPGTYRPDFIVENTRMVECKPINLQGTVMVQAKAQAAIAFCSEQGMTYEFVDPDKISWNELFELERLGDVKFTDRTKAKLHETSLDPARASGLRKVINRCRNDPKGTQKVREDQSR